MRKIIRWGLLGTLLGTALLYWAAAAWRSRSNPALCQGDYSWNEELEGTFDEPKPVDTLVPGRLDPEAGGQPFEAIDLLRPENGPKLAEKEEPPYEPRPSAEGLVPAKSVRSADEQDGLRWMSHRETEQLHAAPDPAGDAKPHTQLGGSEEQEEPMEPAMDSKAIEQRLKSVLQSYLNKGKWGPAAVDTLEFRPSDAKKGEFDRIPF
jgi:hypothetical protein